MLIKICGITRDEDAQAAADLGAAAIGFVFWPRSPRAIDPAAAGRIVARLPPFVSAVGVFVNESPEVIAEIVETAGLDVVQLHGDESPGDCARIGRRTVKAIPATTQAFEGLHRWPQEVTLLLDAADRERRGGTGRVLDWELAAKFSARRRVILAGGLSPANVIEAVRVVRPWAIDVSSGVEQAPGVKDRARMRALFTALDRQ